MDCCSCPARWERILLPVSWWKAAFKSIGTIFESVGVTYADVVKTTCFLADIQDFGAFNEIYRQYFTGKPARSCFAVKDLPMGAQVEIEVIVSMENK